MSFIFCSQVYVRISAAPAHGSLWSTDNTTLNLFSLLLLFCLFWELNFYTDIVFFMLLSYERVLNTQLSNQKYIRWLNPFRWCLSDTLILFPYTVFPEKLSFLLLLHVLRILFFYAPSAASFPFSLIFKANICTFLFLAQRLLKRNI